MWKKSVSAIAAVAIASFGLGVVPSPASAADPKVVLCHATGSDSNPFVEIEVSAAGAFNGHLGAEHQAEGDIIPPFSYNGQQRSQNWDAEGQAILANGCMVGGTAPDGGDDDPRVVLCHATGSDTNPFVEIEISAAGAFNGHLGDGDGDHQGAEDIIPPFTFNGQEYSQNWDAEGQAIFERGCVPGGTPPNGGEEDPRVTLCHATGSETNPFEEIEISAAGAFNGHLGDGNGDHQGAEDIIPPFTFNGQEYSQNWDAEGQAIFDNGCVVPEGPGPGPGPLPPDCDKVCPVKAKGNGKDIRCNGVREGTFNNVRVRRGDTCILVDSQVNGNLVSDYGRNIMVFDTTIVGNVNLNHISGDVRFGNKNGCRYDPAVGGNLTIKNSHNVLVCQTTVCKALNIRNNDGRITVMESTVRRLEVVGNRRFDPDGRRSHARESVIRLRDINVRSMLIKGNEPRKVQKRNVR